MLPGVVKKKKQVNFQHAVLGKGLALPSVMLKYDVGVKEGFSSPRSGLGLW